MGQIKEYEYVDLGLPSGLKWAKCNIGAETETDYGDYFMWGSTIPNNDTPCDWEYAPFNNGSRDYNETYFDLVKDIVCTNGVLAKEYDAAYNATDGMARMPIKDEIQELLDNTDNEWVENYNGSGVNGRKFISKTNGNSIFFPASGNGLGPLFINRGCYCFVWSSSLFASCPYEAWNLGFNSDYIGADDSSYRYLGFVVRGVMD